MEKFNKVEALLSGQTFCLLRDDNVVIGVTEDLTKIPQIISEEYCGVGVEIEEVSYQNHDYTYDIKAKLIDGEDRNEYDFTLATAVKY